MQVTQKNLSETKVQLTITADAEILAGAKKEAVAHVAKGLKLQGFREGKAPASLVEKVLIRQHCNLSSSTLQ